MQRLSRAAMAALALALLLMLTMVGLHAGSSQAAALAHRPHPTPTPTPTPSPTPPPPSPGTWALTGSMNQDRDTYTLTVLQNGQVLAAGGDEDQYPVASNTSELYNPATGTWTYTNGLMNAARSGHTATLLPNGEVLVAGGMDIDESTQATAELYNPATGTWTATGSMSAARQDATATLLQNGQVLVAGGCAAVNGGDCTSTASAELYNPATGTWTATGSMHVARSDQTATLLQNGEVLVAGGVSCADTCSSPTPTYVHTSSAELYNPATGTWALTGSMNEGLAFQTATLLPDGRVLVAGGAIITPTDPWYAVADAELYDPVTGTWTATGSLNQVRFDFTATLLPNGQVLAAGGENNSNYNTSAELYNPATGTWTYTGNMHYMHTLHSAVLLKNGKVLVAGGIFCSYDSNLGCNLAELYTP